MDHRLQVFKALGDNTRYAIYLELARAEHPVATGDIAEALDLHANTVRPHLERMREVGLIEVEAESRGSVGRPQHRWTLAADSPSLGLEPSSIRILASLLAGVAAAGGPEADLVAGIGQQRGRVAADEMEPYQSGCVDALIAELRDLGFDPAVASDGSSTTIAFTRCPFAELAAAFPGIVCHLHRGMVEGFVKRWGGAEVERFATLEDRDPCRVELAVG